MRRFTWERPIGLVLLLLVSLNLIAQEPLSYREALLTALTLIQDTQALNEQSVQGANIELALQELEHLTDAELEELINPSLSLAEVNALLEDAQFYYEHARDSRSSSGSNDQVRSDTVRSTEIDIPSIDVTPSYCANTTGAAYVAALAVQKTIQLIFAAIKFECQQTLLGENGALACLAPDLLKIAAETEVELGEFCLNQQRAAKGEASLDLERNIGEHLNTYIDETTTSSRASQDSLDDLQDDVTSMLSDLDTTQNDLDSYFITVNADLNTVLSDLEELDEEITELIALADDIQFRVEENEAEAEDVEERTADLQESTTEIRTDTQSIISTISDIQSSADAVVDVFDDRFTQLERDRIAAVLAQSGVFVADYTVPASSGGQLETAREVLIQAITDLSSLGLGNVTLAQNLLAQGDVQYNSQNYLQAYGLYAQAYQSLSNGTRR